jgi:2-dehydropantoate 2-reductase
MKISVIGAGAMGSLYGGRIAAAGYEAALYDINAEHMDRINSMGLVIEDLLTGEELNCKPMAGSDPGIVKGSDFIVIFVKSTATEAVAEQFKDIAGPSCIVVTLQNGVGNEEILRGIFGADRTAAGVTSHGATFLSTGKIRHAGKGPTYLCMSDKKNGALSEFVKILNKAGFETFLEPNIESLVWSKLIINVGINALTALTGVQNGRLLDFPETKAIMADLIDEAMKVIKAKGIRLSYKDPLATVYEVAKKTALNRSSMLQDFDRKSRSEIDFINNAIVREADKFDIPVPVNRTLTALVKTIDTVHTEA